ncbi:MAG: hypothetical protein Q9190_008083, partial [Brigantiaea leucoxantha]
MDPPTPSPPQKSSSAYNISAISSPAYPSSRPNSDPAICTLSLKTKSQQTSHIERSQSAHGRYPHSELDSPTNSLNGHGEFSMDDFSIDLAKLGEKSSSGLSLGNAGRRAVEGIPSEDDGPEDFTMRMGEWMKGTISWGKHRDGGNEGAETHGSTNGGVQPEQNESRADRDKDVRMDDDDQSVNGSHDESEFLPLSTSTPAPLMGQAQEFVPSPPLSRHSTEAKQNRTAEEVFDHISALQLEVERLRSQNEQYQSTQCSFEQARARMQSEGHALQTQLRDLRSEAARLQDSEFKASQKILRLEQELRRDGSKVGSLRAKFEPLSQELEATKLRAEADKQGLESKVDSLQQELQRSRDLYAKQRSDFDSVRTTHAREIDALKSNLDMCQQNQKTQEELLHARHEADASARESLRKEMHSALNAAKAAASMHEVELARAKDQLTETRRVLATVENENDRLIREKDRQANRIAEIKSLVEERTAELNAAQFNSKELENEITRLHTSFVGNSNSNNNTQTSDPEIENLKTQHKTALQSLRTKHAKDIKILRSAIIKSREETHRRERELADTYQDEIEALKEKIESLSSPPPPPPPQNATEPADPAGTVAELRTAIRVL